MFSTITLLIDNEAVFLNDFIEMAKDARDRRELADWIECWFSDALELEKVEVVVNNVWDNSPKYQDDEYKKLTESYRHVFQSFLAAAIENVSESDWLSLADHYITKATESQQ